MKDFKRGEEKFIKYIRQFNTKELLDFFSKESIISYQTDKKGYSNVDIHFFKKSGEKIETIDFVYGQWELVQICYYSIKFSNDFRGKSLNQSDFYNLLNENKNYDELMEKIDYSSGSIKLFQHLQCLSNVQFDFQALNIITRFNRLYEIMININKNADFKQTREVCYIDFEKVFKEITGMNISKFINIYLFIILLSSTRMNTNIYDIINDINIDIDKLGFSKKEILNIIEIQSRDYEFYKKGDNWNLLKYYPIVKTDKGNNNYVISNIYSLIYSFPETIYWIIRNYYKDNEKNDFTIYFGYCFECYLQQLFERYKINYKKLKEREGIKTPDWKIETNDYIFLIEQKAALFSINTRTSSKKERFTDLEKYIDKNILKAFDQLNEYIEISKKPIIRICLTFEKIYMEENMKLLLERKWSFNSDINLNWIINITEFEVLMQLLDENEEEFNRIIQQKINLEASSNKNVRNFEKLLQDYEYKYIRELNHFHRLGEEMKDKLKNLEN